LCCPPVAGGNDIEMRWPMGGMVHNVVWWASVVLVGWLIGWLSQIIISHWLLICFWEDRDAPRCHDPTLPLPVLVTGLSRSYVWSRCSFDSLLFWLVDRSVWVGPVRWWWCRRRCLTVRGSFQRAMCSSREGPQVGISCNLSHSCSLRAVRCNSVAIISWTWFVVHPPSVSGGRWYAHTVAPRFSASYFMRRYEWHLIWAQHDLSGLPGNLFLFICIYFFAVPDFIVLIFFSFFASVCVCGVRATVLTVDSRGSEVSLSHGKFILLLLL